MGDKLFPHGNMPSREVIWDQMQLAQLSITVYAMLPVLGFVAIEEGYTRSVVHSAGGCARLSQAQYSTDHESALVLVTMRAWLAWRAVAW